MDELNIVLLLNESSLTLANIDRLFKATRFRLKKQLISLAVRKPACLGKLELQEHNTRKREWLSIYKEFDMLAKMLHPILFGNGHNKLKTK